MISRIPRVSFLWISIVLFAVSNSVVRILMDLGAQHPIEGRNAISLCNLFFAGNMCAALALFALYHRQWTMGDLRLLSKTDWMTLLALALLTGVFALWFFFVAIENTMVTNVVLIAQLEPPSGIGIILANIWRAS